MILAFVSFLGASRAIAQTKAQTKASSGDDFSLFEDELKNEPTKAKTAPAAAFNKEAPTAKVERLKAELKNDPQNSNVGIELANTYYQLKQYEAATTLYWKNVDKLDRASMLNLARAHQAKNEPNDMIRILHILLGKDEKDYEASALLGDAFFMQKKPKEAMEAYKTAIENNSKYEPAYQGLVKIYESRNPPNLYELRILFQDMSDNIGARAEYAAKLCEINYKDGTFEPAIAKCKEAIQKSPDNPENYVYLALSQKDGEAVEGTSLKNLKKSADKFPKSELAQYTYAKTLEDQKNFVDAFKYYKVATDADAKSARSWLGLATSAFEIRKFDVALEAYKKACKFDRKFAVNFRKAATNLKLGHNSEWAGRYDNAAEACGF
jgi:tetratricopeptide (TPR) repeat protein